MVYEKLKATEDFTQSEKNIAEFILDNSNQIQKFTADDLAQRTYTSRATVTRFCHKLGMQGYRDFQQQLSLDLSDLNRIKNLVSDDPIDAHTQYEELVDILPSIYEKALTQTKMVVDHEVIKRVTAAIRQAGHLSLYGIGISNILAQSAAFKLMTIGVECSAYDGLNEHYILAKKNRHKEMAIVFSLTGTNPTILSIARYLKSKDIFVVAVIGNKSSQMHEICDEVIEFYPQETLLSFEALDSFMSATYIIDLIFTNLLVKDYQHNVDVAIEILKNESRN